MPLHPRRPAALAMFALAALAAPTAPARAEPIDLTRASCADFTAMSETDRAQLSLWLAGYYAGSAQRPLVDADRIASAPAALAELCAKSPQLPLVGAETRAAFIPAPTP
ncbi:MAG: hypothetical protein DI527_13445 [Chelatococcus sp.]|nr:MAG: hypothetical protein DI527_13445 [Chelatococcus sp.]